MNNLTDIGGYIWANKQWLFDGIGIVIVTAFFGAVAWIFRTLRAARYSTAKKLNPYAPATRPRRAPEVEFSDGINAGVTVLIDLRLNEIFKMLQRFKDWDALLATFNPRIEMRIVQILEAHSYEEAKALRPKFEKQLMREFTPQLAEYGVQLRRIGIGKFVTFDPQLERLGETEVTRS